MQKWRLSSCLRVLQRPPLEPDVEVSEVAWISEGSGSVSTDIDADLQHLRIGPLKHLETLDITILDRQKARKNKIYQYCDPKPKGGPFHMNELKR